MNIVKGGQPKENVKKGRLPSGRRKRAAKRKRGELSRDRVNGGIAEAPRGITGKWEIGDLR